MPILSYKKLNPKISENAYVSPNATIIGDVTIKDHAIVWPGSILRADFSSITIGSYTTIFDGVCMHTRSKNSPINIGNYSIIETGSCIYGLFSQDYVTISRNTVVFEGTSIGEGVLILPDSMVPAGMTIPSRTVMQGDPVITIRELSREDMERQRDRAEHYSELFDKIRINFPSIQPYMTNQADFFKFMLNLKEEKSIENL
ncbi:MAG: gamma carbonic anhydrase family protein [Promethearchaeota archaeon]